MFTGIIEEIGKVRRIDRSGSSARIDIAASIVLEGTRIGDSIACSGVCLTVIGISSKGFTADMMPETISRSALGRLHPGGGINLERALLPTTRLGGHIVSGHIDGVGCIKSIAKNEIASVVTIEAPEEICRYTVEKGSVALDGVSLTIVDASTDSFSVSLIPHTFKHTTFGEAEVGDAVNIECDIIGKYVGRLLSTEGSISPTEHSASEIDIRYLADNGFL